MRRSEIAMVPADTLMPRRCPPSSRGNIRIDSRIDTLREVSWTHWQISRRDMEGKTLCYDPGPVTQNSQPTHSSQIWAVSWPSRMIGVSRHVPIETPSETNRLQTLGREYRRGGSRSRLHPHDGPPHVQSGGADRHRELRRRLSAEGLQRSGAGVVGRRGRH